MIGKARLARYCQIGSTVRAGSFEQRGQKELESQEGEDIEAGVKDGRCWVVV